ncbi:MAG: metal-dependent hydrolase [Actinomycetota bacterium]
MLFWHLGTTVAVVFFTLGRRSIDYRVVMLGGILPDLIDKPIGLVFDDRFATTRLYGHTLLLTVSILLLVQLTLRGNRARTWFVLPIASALHLVFDAMWNFPITLFWPFFSTGFPASQTGWLDPLLHPLEHWVKWLMEIAGIALLVYFAAAYRLFDRPRIKAFLKTGRLTDKEPSAA